MTKEDLEFLKELQDELKNQETDGQAAPRFWGVIETREQIVPTGYGSIWKIIDRTYEPEEYDAESYADLIDDLVEDEDVTDEVRELWGETDRNDMNEIVDFASEHLNRNVEVLEFTKESRLSDQTGCFLTKRAAKKHIEKNAYHYYEPRTFAMTAWRNPEFERFMKIFENLDLDKLEITQDV